MPITDPQCHLLTLPDELIFQILSYCPVESVLKLENTCRRLFQICRSKTVWRSLILKLDIAQAPNSRPFQIVESHPEPDLRRKVTDAIRRHRAWNTPGALPPMRVLELPLPHIEESRLMKTRLLPGGKEILLANHGTVELWSVGTGQCLWTISAPEEHIDTVGFELDIVDNGKVLAVAIVCEDSVFPAMSLLRIYTYNFTDRLVELVLERRLPTVSPSRIMLQGSFFVASIPRAFQSIVINWRTGDALIFDFINPTGVRTDARSKLVVDDHLIVFVQDAELGFCAVKIPLSSLRNYWSDETDHNAWRRIPFRPSEQDYPILPLPYPLDAECAPSGSSGYGPWILIQHTFRPPWLPNAPTEIFIVAYTVTPGGTKPMRLITLRLQLYRSESMDAEAGSSTLTLVKSTSAPVERLPRNPRNISNAALAFSLRQNLQVFSLFSEDPQPISEVELGPDVVPESEEFDPNISSVDPWSGAIAIRMPGGMKVLHFD